MLKHGLNNPITAEQILQCVKTLKGNKVAGYDDIIYAYLSTTIDM